MPFRVRHCFAMALTASYVTSYAATARTAQIMLSQGNLAYSEVTIVTKNQFLRQVRFLSRQLNLAVYFRPSSTAPFQLPVMFGFS